MSTTDDNLQEQIFQMLYELTAIPPEELSLEDELQGDINLDSVSALELLGMMDEEFGIEIDIEEVRDVATVGDMVDLTRSHIDER